MLKVAVVDQGYGLPPISGMVIPNGIIKHSSFKLFQLNSPYILTVETKRRKKKKKVVFIMNHGLVLKGIDWLQL